jgi:dehydrogenase/reductase SDR family protein 12
MTAPEHRLRRTLDTALDVAVPASLSALGYHLRHRLWHWDDPAGPDLAGRVYLVTGATSGMGRATAALLAAAGAEVVVHGRNPDKVAQVVSQLTAAASAPVTGEVADLSLLVEAAALADRVARAHPRLHGLVNNAGLLSPEHTVTTEGVEATAAVTVLAPFILVGRLAAGLDRVVTVASAGLYGQPLEVDRLEAGADGYRGAAAYARGKRAQLALTHQWPVRLGVAARAVDPGWVDTAGLAEGLPRFHRLMRPLLRSAEEGADTAVWLSAVDPLPGTAQGLWRDRRPRFEHVSPRTRYRPVQEERLWRWCEQRSAAVLGTAVPGTAAPGTAAPGTPVPGTPAAPQRPGPT